MAIFEDVELIWAGKTYKVESKQVMQLIGRMEQHIKIKQLIDPDGPPLSSLATAYGTALRFAGATISDEQVYSYLFEDGTSNVPAVITGIMMLMMPRDVLNKQKTGASKKKKKPRKK
jgi:hypothetical protein